MIMILVGFLTTTFGIITGFLLGKKASHWCPGCGQIALPPARREPLPARREPLSARGEPLSARREDPAPRRESVTPAHGLPRHRATSRTI